MPSEYKSFKGVYDGNTSGMTEFVHFLMFVVVSFVTYMICSQTEWVDGLAEIFGIGWGWVAFGMWWILAAVFVGICQKPLSSYEAKRRQELIACPNCQHETEIIKDDLLSESVIGERKKDSSGKLKIEHYRVGTRQVKIACKACDYTKTYELKFKERT